MTVWPCRSTSQRHFAIERARLHVISWSSRPNVCGHHGIAVFNATHIRRLKVFGKQELAELSAVTIDCVEGGASIGFLLPMTVTKAEAFWTSATASALRGERLVLVAQDAAGVILGTVAVPENQP